MKPLLLLGALASVLPAQQPPAPPRDTARPARMDSVIISATRAERRVSDSPLRVEVLEREEVEEKMMMTPGDISMMLNETGGLRVQVTSPMLGGASARIQGLRGRYTLMLADGLPLYGGQAGAFSLLQIPPMDLARVEVVKGVASALYGASALGGVINLVSRRPTPEGDHELLLNQLLDFNGSDVVLWSSRQVGDRIGYSFLGGAHRQAPRDVDDDAWHEIPDVERYVIRPRVFLKGRGGANAITTFGMTSETREAGGFPGPDPFASGRRDRLRTWRVDAGAIARKPFSRGVMTARLSGVSTDHTHQRGDQYRDTDRHQTGFGEISASMLLGRHTGVIGAAWQVDRFASTLEPRHDFRHSTPALFAQADIDVTPRIAVSASGRLDDHNVYGAMFNPRVSALLRLGGEWTARASAGTGSFAPTPFIEETEITGLEPLSRLSGVRAERAKGASIDVGGPFGALELSGSLFASRVEDPLMARAGAGLSIINGVRTARTDGADVLVRHRSRGVTSTFTYTHVRAYEESRSTDSDSLFTLRVVPLVPRNAFGFVSVLEDEQKRIGFELYYTGSQKSGDHNPFIVDTPDYFIFGLVAERRVGRARWFINLENIGDTRMTKFHEFVVARDAAPSLPLTTDVWAPLDGRTINAGVRIALGKAD